MNTKNTLSKKKPGFPEHELHYNSFKILFDNSPASIIIHDCKTGEVIRANKAALKQYEIDSPADFTTARLWLAPPYSFDDALKLITKASMEGIQEFEWQFRNPRGEFFWEHVKLVPVVMEGKRHILATTININEQKKTELRFKNKNSRLDKALEEVNHAWSFQTMIYFQ